MSINLENIKVVSMSFDTEIADLRLSSMDWRDELYPELKKARIVGAEFKDSGEILSDEDLEELNDNFEFVQKELQDFLY